MYAIDIRLAQSNSVSFSTDKGRLLENIVFLHLKKCYKEVYYFKENNECDFIARDENKKLYAFQVCYNINSDNLDREIAGLREAMNKLKIESGKIITFNQVDKIDSIEIIPAWKLLSG